MGITKSVNSSNRVAFAPTPSLCISPVRRKQTRLCSGKDSLFLSVSLSKDRSERECKDASTENNEIRGTGNGKRRVFGGVKRSGTMNTQKHLWAGAVAAMVSKTFLAPLERLKLEYTVHDEQRNLLVVAQTIATTQGFKGFWKGNLLSVLRTAPFKAVNFCAYESVNSNEGAGDALIALLVSVTRSLLWEEEADQICSGLWYWNGFRSCRYVLRASMGDQ
ncbi:unnamed protein product [Microthlaspi erraticum]|uniref:ADP,ATP carrier protein n=1 Tax=Microthlaspi erraticum TaxID=1685480 RepID=A0A6D2IGK7_9BRAS|nr:unnamed protein product [Microthlaspi erraticum]